MSTSNTSNMNLNLNYNMNEAKFIINEKFNTTNAYKLLKIANLLDTETTNKLKKYIGLAKDGEVKVEYTVNSIGRLEIAAIPSKGKNSAGTSYCSELHEADGERGFDPADAHPQLHGTAGDACPAA